MLASHLGQEDRRNYFNHVEERGGLRRQAIRSASSLSISGESAFPSAVILSGGGRLGSGGARFEGEYQSMSWAASASAASHRFHAMPPRIIRNSDRPRASDRTMITTHTPRSLATSPRLEWRCRHRQRTQRGQIVQSKIPQRIGGTLVQTVGWISRHRFARPPVDAEIFLDIPPQKQTQDCTATVIWRPSLAAFF